LISQFPPSFKQKCLTSKYENPFNSIGADATSQMDRYHVYIEGVFVYFAKKKSEVLEIYLTIFVNMFEIRAGVPHSV